MNCDSKADLATQVYLEDFQDATAPPRDDTLTGDASSVDISTMANMQKLVQIGNELLKKPLSRVNLETGRFDEVQVEGTNEAALIHFAKLLSEEKKLRQAV